MEVPDFNLEVELKPEDIANEVTAYFSNDQQDCKTRNIETKYDTYCNFSQKLAFEIKTEEEDNPQETDNVPGGDNINQEIKQEDDNTMNGIETVKLDEYNDCLIVSDDQGNNDINQDTDDTSEGIDSVLSSSIFHISQPELRGGNSLKKREKDGTAPPTVAARPPLSTSSTSTADAVVPVRSTRNKRPLHRNNNLGEKGTDADTITPAAISNEDLMVDTPAQTIRGGLKQALEELGPSRTLDQWNIYWQQKRKVRDEGGALNRARYTTSNVAKMTELSGNCALVLGVIGQEMAVGRGPEESPIGFTPAATPQSTPGPCTSRPVHAAVAPGSSGMQTPAPRASVHRPATQRRARRVLPPKRILNAHLELNNIIKELITEVRRSNKMKEEHLNFLRPRRGFSPTHNVEIPMIGSTADRIQFEEDSESTEEWEINMNQNPGSDIEEDLDPSPMNSYRQISSYPADEESVPSNILKRILEVDSADDLTLRKIVDSDMQNFNWTDCIEEFKGEQETFTGPSGATMPVEELSSPLAVFEMIWDDDIMDLMVRETNSYARQLMSLSSSSNSTLKRWHDVCKGDIWLFLAVTMLQSFVHINVEKEHWYPLLPHLATDIFKETMSFKKFTLLKKCLHFVDNQNIPKNANQKLAKIKPLIDHLNTKFSSLYLPEQIVAIDESLIPWKGTLPMAQQISKNVAKVGIRSCELCESKSGYLWRMSFHPGKHDGSSKQHEFPEDAEKLDELEGASQIVYDLVRPLLNKGHTLVMNSFYNSPLLSRFLKSKNTDTMGTMRLNREFVPDSLKRKTKTNMRQGEVAFSQTEDLSVVVWRDLNLVPMISTYHKTEVHKKSKSDSDTFKPKVVLDYNNFMGSVDKRDQFLSAYSMERTGNTVWYKKLFRRLVNVSIHNAWVLHSQRQITKYRQFRMTLIKEILFKYKGLFPRHVQSQVVVGTATGERCRPNLVGGHYPERNKTGRNRCKMCSSKKITTRTVWRCDTCKIDLCVLGCFKEYHT